MLKNYFTIAWRNLWKNRTFTLLNLGGLTISLAACLMIFFWVTDELNYDTAGANADRVYRVALTLQAKGQPDKKFALTAPTLAPVLVTLHWWVFAIAALLVELKNSFPSGVAVMV